MAIKVDREQHPDVDAVYQAAIQVLGGTGGWPASLWLTPDGVPFHAGTYFPPTSSPGRQGFGDALTQMATAWDQERERVDRVAAQVVASLETGTTVVLLDEPPPDDTPARAVAQAWTGWDPVDAGWGRANKFPAAPMAQWLLGHGLLTGDEQTLSRVRALLDAMAAGGLRDHLGGGFHRYTVDPTWTVPHFEKMLDDNAQLLRLYADAAVALDEPRYAAVAQETAAWMLEALRTETGCFRAAWSADDPGGEGAYYTWTPDELVAVLGRARGTAFAQAYGVTEAGTFQEGRSVLRLVDGTWDDPALSQDRGRLAEARAQRPEPAVDPLVIVAWNGLAIGGLARAGRLLDAPEPPGRRCAQGTRGGHVAGGWGARGQARFAWSRRREGPTGSSGRPRPAHRRRGWSR